MDLSLWLTFVLASGVLLIVPGPTILLVLSYGLSQGRRTALASAAGVALGDAVAMTCSLAGLGTLVLASATLFTVLKWIGAVYLVWMGIGMIRSAAGAGGAGPAPAVAAVPARAVFRHAATVTALNPKSIVFFIAFVPQFIRPDAPLVPQFAILIATFVGLATLNALTFALAADLMRRQIRRPAVLVWLQRLGGSVLVAMGVVTAGLRRAA